MDLMDTSVSGGLNVWHQLAKLVVTAVAGFAASQAAGNGYDKIVSYSRTHKVQEVPEQ